MSQKNDLHIRLNEKEKGKIEENAIKFGFHTVSEFIRFIGINIKNIEIEIKNENPDN